LFEKITLEVQQHPSRKEHTMTAYAQNLLAINANKLSLAFPPVVAAVSCAARELRLAAEVHATSTKNNMALRFNMLRRFFTYGNLALAGSLWTSLALGDVPARAPRDTARAIEPAPLALEDHWRRAAGVLAAAIAGVQRVKTLQAAASRQIDSADYALTQLIHDLRAAMPLPADVSALRAVLAEAERTAPERRRSSLAA
jgi:hypothetical protein